MAFLAKGIRAALDFERSLSEVTKLIGAEPEDMVQLKQQLRESALDLAKHSTMSPGEALGVVGAARLARALRERDKEEADRLNRDYRRGNI